MLDIPLGAHVMKTFPSHIKMCEKSCRLMQVWPRKGFMCRRWKEWHAFYMKRPKLQKKGLWIEFQAKTLLIASYVSQQPTKN